MLSTRELTLVLRARDEASRVLRGVGASMGTLSAAEAAAARASFMHGQALATAGIAVASAGALALVALNSMTDAAIQYNQEASKTLTQTDHMGLSLQQVKNMGLEVARTVPVAFEQIQPALYDIFSSIDVNAPQAAVLLQAIGKAAVGGAVDMHTAGRVTLAILNAWKMSANDVNHVNDVMFQLVRKGVGTYQEFGSTIGRAIPSALRAGQSVESLAGMMAFLTRNGLSAAMASTSAARALDAISNPKAGKALKEIGVNVTDATGHFRPMVDIVTELRDKLAKLSPAARAAALQNIFKGAGGTIQAMRFFNLAISDSHGLLQTMTADMHNAGGAADAAYKIMANTPQAQMQLLNNRYQTMAVTIGSVLIPVKMKLVQIISTIMGWFLSLNPQLQSNIVKWVAIAAAVAVLVGVLAAIAGLFMMFSAAVALAGFTMGAVVAVIGGVVAGIAALIAIGYLVVQNWDSIKAAAAATWANIAPVVNGVVNAVENFGKAVGDTFSRIWQVIGPQVIEGWNTIKNAVSSAITALQPYWQMLVDAWNNLRDKAASVSVGVTDWLTRIWTVLQPIVYMLAGAFTVLWQIIVNVFSNIMAAGAAFVGNILQILSGLINFVVAVFTGDWEGAWNAVVSILKGIVGAIVAIIQGGWGILTGIISGLVNGIIGFFQHLWDVLVGHSIIPDMVNGIISWISRLPGAVLGFIAHLVSSAISWFQNLFSNIISRVSSGISSVVSWFAGLPGRVLGPIASFASNLISRFISMMSTVASRVASGVTSTVGFFLTLPWKSFNALATLGPGLLSRAASWMANMLSGVTGHWGSISSFFSSIPGRILGALGNLGGLLWNAGSSVMSGFLSGLKSQWGNVTSFVGGVGSWIASHKGPREYDLKLLRPHGGWIMTGLREGMKRSLPALRNTLQNVADTISNADFPVPGSGSNFGGLGPAFPGGFGPAGPGGPSAPGVQIPITVNTQEIDPLKHAADLGYEIAGRLGM